jgi:hypothetical protein
MSIGNQRRNVPFASRQIEHAGWIIGTVPFVWQCPAWEDIMRHHFLVLLVGLTLFLGASVTPVTASDPPVPAVDSDNDGLDDTLEGTPKTDLTSPDRPASRSVGELRVLDEEAPWPRHH